MFEEATVTVCTACLAEMPEGKTFGDECELCSGGDVLVDEEVEPGLVRKLGKVEHRSGTYSQHESRIDLFIRQRQAAQASTHSAEISESIAAAQDAPPSPPEASDTQEENPA